MNIYLAHIKMNIKAKLIALLSIIVLFDFSCTNVSHDNSSTNERQIFETSAENYVAGLDNVRINYTKHSEGDNILLFVHGWSCDQTYWKEQIDFFKSDYQVITTDLAGHGLSTVGARTGWTNHYKDSLGFVIATIPDANHFLMLEKPIAFNNELKKALTSNYR